MEMEEVYISNIGYRVSKESAEFAYKCDFLCATCLSRNRVLYNLDKHLRVLMISLGIMMTGPQKVCWECVALLKKIINFKKMAIKAQLQLMETGMDEINSIKSMSKLRKTKRVKALSITRKIKQKNEMTYDPKTTVVISQKAPPPLRPLKSLKTIPIKNQDLYVQIECVKLETEETNPNQSEDMCANITSSQQNIDDCVETAPFESGESNLKQNEDLLAALTSLASVESSSKQDESASIEIVPPLECTELNVEQNTNYFGNLASQSRDQMEKKSGQVVDNCVKLPHIEFSKFNSKQNENCSKTSEPQSTEHVEKTPKQDKNERMEIALSPTESTELNHEQNKNYSEDSKLQSTEYVETNSNRDENERMEITLSPTESTELNPEQNKNYSENSDLKSTEYVETNSKQDENERMEITLPPIESTKLNVVQNENYTENLEPQSTEYLGTNSKHDKNERMEIVRPPTESTELNVEQNENYSENLGPQSTEYAKTSPMQDKDACMEIAHPPTEFNAEYNLELESTEHVKTNSKEDENERVLIALPPTESTKLNTEQNKSYSENSELQSTEYVEKNTKQDKNERMDITLLPTGSTEFNVEQNENYSENLERQATEYAETSPMQDKDGSVEIALPPAESTDFNAKQNYSEISEPQCTEYVETNSKQDESEQMEIALSPTESVDINAEQNKYYSENSELKSTKRVETNLNQDENERIEIALKPRESTELNPEQNKNYSENSDLKSTEYVETNSKQDENERMEITLPSIELNVVQNENYSDNLEPQSTEYVKTNSKQDENERVLIALPPTESTKLNTEQNKSYSENSELQSTEYVEKNTKQDKNERMDIILPPTGFTEFNVEQNENYSENLERQATEYAETSPMQDKDGSVEIALPPAESPDFNAKQNYSEISEPQSTEYVETNSKQDKSERMEIALSPTESVEINAEQNKYYSENSELKSTKRVETNLNQDENERIEIALKPRESTELNPEQNKNYSENSDLKSTEYVETNSKQDENERMEITLPPIESTKLNVVQNENYTKNLEPQSTEYLGTNSKHDENERMEIVLPPTESTELNVEQNENYSGNLGPQSTEYAKTSPMQDKDACMEIAHPPTEFNAEYNLELDSTEYIKTNSKQDENERMLIALPPTEPTELNNEQNKSYSENSELQSTEHVKNNSKHDKNERMDITLPPTGSKEFSVEQNENYSENSEWRATEYAETRPMQDKDGSVEIALPPAESTDFNAKQNYSEISEPQSTEYVETNSKQDKSERMEIALSPTESAEINAEQNENCSENSEMQFTKYVKTNSKQDNNARVETALPHKKSTELNAEQNEKCSGNSEPQSTEYVETKSKQNKNEQMEIALPPTESNVEQNENYCGNSELQSNTNLKQNKVARVENALPPSKSIECNCEQNENNFVNIAPKSLGSTETNISPTNNSYNEITSQFSKSTETNGVRNEDTCVRISQQLLELTKTNFEQNLDQGIITATQSLKYRKTYGKPIKNVCDKITTKQRFLLPNAVEENANKNEDPYLKIAMQSMECEETSTKQVDEDCVEIVEPLEPVQDEEDCVEIIEPLEPVQDEEDCIEIVESLEPVQAIVKQTEVVCVNISPLESGGSNSKQNIYYYMIPALKSANKKSKRNKKPPLKKSPGPVKYVIHPVPLQRMQSNFNQTENIYGKTESPRLKCKVLNEEQKVNNFVNVIPRPSKFVKSKPIQDNNPCHTIVQHHPVEIRPKRPSQSLLKFNPGYSDTFIKYQQKMRCLKSTPKSKPFVSKNAISTTVSNKVIPKPSLVYLDDEVSEFEGEFASVNKFLTAIKSQEIQLMHAQTTPESVDNVQCLETNMSQIEDTTQNVSVEKLPQMLLKCNENMSSDGELRVYVLKDGQIDDTQYQKVNSITYFDNDTIVCTPLYCGDSDIPTAELDHQLLKSVNTDGRISSKTANVKSTMAEAIENTTVHKNVNTITIQNGRVLLPYEKDSLSIDHSEVDRMEYDYPSAMVDNNDNVDINKKHDITKEKQQLIVNRVISGTSLTFSSDEIQKTINEGMMFNQNHHIPYLNSEISSVKNTDQIPMVIVEDEAQEDVTNIPYMHTKEVEKSDEVVIAKNLHNVWLDHPYCRRRNLFISDNNSEVECLGNTTSCARTNPCTGRVPRGLKRINPKKANEDIIKKVSDNLKESSHTHTIEKDIILPEVDPSKKYTVEVATLEDPLEALICDSLLVNVKVEKSDSALANDRNIEEEYDWTVERYNLEQSGLIKQNHINTDDSITGSTSEPVELDTPVLCDYNWTVNNYNLEENELNIKPEVISNNPSVTDTASEMSDAIELEQFNAPAFTKYQSDASSDSFQDYTYVPPESLNEDQEAHYRHLLNEPDANVVSEFDTNNITVSFSSLFDANSQVESIENADKSEINNVIGSEQRNMSPGLLEPLYFTDWVDETYSYVLNKKIDVPSKGIKRKAPSQCRAKTVEPSNAESSDAQIINPAPKRMKKKEGSNWRRKRSKCINRNLDKLKHSKKLKQNPTTEIVESVVDRLNNELLNIAEEDLDSQKDEGRNISVMNNDKLETPEENSNVPHNDNENTLKEANNITSEPIIDNSAKEYSNKDLEGVNYDKLLLRPVVLLENIMPSGQSNNDEDEFVECEELVESDDNVLKELQSLAKIITDKLTTNDEDTMEETIEEQIQGKDDSTSKQENLLQTLDFSVAIACSGLVEQIKKPVETKKSSKSNKKEKVDTTNTPTVQSENTSVFTIRTLDDGELQGIRSKLLHEPQFKAARDKCHKCILTFHDLSAKELHDEQCHDVSAGYYVCKICKCRFRNKTGLEMHNTSHESCLQCPHCPKEYLHDSVLMYHIKNKHPDSIHASLIPNRNEREKSDSNRKEKKYKCRICEKEYAYPESLKSHVTIKHAVRNTSYIAADNCLNSNINDFSHNNTSVLSLPDDTLSLMSNSLTSADNLSSRRRRDRKTKKNTCRICGNNYKYAHSLKHHINLKHGMKMTSNTNNKNSAYNLTIPDTTLNSPSHKDSEIIKHICKICAYEYKYARSLRAHVTREHGMKKARYTAKGENLSLPDNTLSLPSNSLSSAEKLRLRNKKAKKYKCRICSKSYKHACYLNSHLALKHGIRTTSHTATDKNLTLPHDTLTLPSNSLSSADNLSLPSNSLSSADNLSLPSNSLSSADNLSLPSNSLSSAENLSLPSNSLRSAENLRFRNKEAKKYKCRICSNAYKDAHYLHSHLAVKHGVITTNYTETDKNLSLPDSTLCLTGGNTVSSSSENYRNLRKYECMFCSNKYKHEQALIKHVSKKHGMNLSYTVTDNCLSSNVNNSCVTDKNLNLPDNTLSLPSKDLSSTENLIVPDNILSLPSKDLSLPSQDLSSTDDLTLMVENLSLKDLNINATNKVQITCTGCKMSFRTIPAFTIHSETVHV